MVKYKKENFYKHRPDEKNPCKKCGHIWFHKKSGECVWCRKESIAARETKKAAAEYGEPKQYAAPDHMPYVKKSAEKTAMKGVSYE